MEDKQLIWKCKRGHREALRRVYEKYHADLLKLAIVLTGQPHTADDIVHDVFVQFVRVVPRMSLTGSLRSYLMTSMLNRVRNHCRDRRRRSEQGLGDRPEPVAPSGCPIQWAILSEQLERLSAAMAQLPYEQREVITLHIQAGMTFRHIARCQNTSTSTVQGRYRYGIDKLRFLLNGERSP